MSTVSESFENTHYTKVLHNGWGEGDMFKRNGSDSMGTGTTLLDKTS